MIQTLADLQPIMVLVLLITMYCIESFRPYLAKPAKKKQHDIHNFFLTAINFALNGVIGFAVLYAVVFTADHQLGLLNQFELPEFAEIIASIMLMDFGSYCIHRLQHRVPFLWRFHRVHHSDTALNTSSSLRFHPIETVLTQGIYTCIAVTLFGVSMTSFVIYGTIALIFVITQHSNVKLPNWIEKYGRYIFSTAGWHKIHHSNEQKFTDSHYGGIFTFWDRIFDTWHTVKPDEIKYGLREFDDAEKQKVGFLLRSPFIDVTKTKTGNE
jgi:sterol desaturase/sphingolipid hydroxylase (fatty acid hydroxylase superfamily)